MKHCEIPDHPAIARAQRTGYPYAPEDEEFEQEAYEAYCDYLYEQERERELFG